MKKVLTLIFLCCVRLVHAQTLVIDDVTLIPMTKDRAVLKHASVTVIGQHIAAINGAIPKGAVYINGKGKWLIPGLIDMHVHTPNDFSAKTQAPTQPQAFSFDTQDIMTPFIANGVTTIFNLNATIETFIQRKEIQRGQVIGPRIAIAALINGGKGQGRVANTPEEGRQAVRDAKAEGYEFIKVYSQLDTVTYFAIVNEAAKAGMRTIGHIPDAFQGKLERVIVPNFGMVAHAEEFSKQAKDFNENEVRHFVAMAKANGTWLSPTLVTMVKIAEQARSLDQLRNNP